MRFYTTSETQTEQLAQRVARQLKPGDVLLLRGEMGSGKTAFVRGLAKALHCPEPVSSPTFSLVHEYGGTPPLVHFDLYRLGDAQEAIEIGLEDYLHGQNICAIEWPEVAAELLPQRCIAVTFLSAREDEREILLEGVDGLAVSGD